MAHNEVTTVNAERVRNLLGCEQLQRLVNRLRRRMSRGQALTGKIQLAEASLSERAAIDKLLGRLPTRGETLTVDLDRLTEILSHARACARLEEAIIVICGPVADEQRASLSCRQAWEEVWQKARGRIESNAAALRWIENLRAGGLLKRLAGSDPRVATTLISQAVSTVEQAPYPAVRLAELAAQRTGNSHAFDRGQPLAALVIRFARQLDESARWKTTAERRDAWEVLGVLCDELSAPVLVLNLRADSESFTGRALNLHAAAGEPYRVSVRQLRRDPPIFDPITSGPVVFVCENPTVVDVAANKLGRSCRPLVCIDGQPKTASRLLLDALVGGGIQIRYHGDFDWDGIRIANTIMRRHDATSWRFNASDYAAASESKHVLKGAPVTSDWDNGLADLMTTTGKCVHEENVLDSLLTDLISHI
ncbi:MAG TPA: TIGR02679 family protein [Pirellulales bacterium]|nr:TIGR02679 family protein [Pirellulales bacterium]